MTDETPYPMFLPVWDVTCPPGWPWSHKHPSDSASKSLFKQLKEILQDGESYRLHNEQVLTNVCIHVAKIY